jgi:CheY-like chemotaxis protein
VIEDNKMDSDLLRMALDDVSDWRVEVILAQDGEEAIKLLYQQATDPSTRSDFVVLDLNLPRHDGTEILHLIRHTEPIKAMPVAVFSSSPQDVIQRKLTAAGVLADGHFTKPLNFDEFLGMGHILRRWYEDHSPASGVGQQSNSP